ncbi:aconitate hydratase, partial [Paenibacillus sp. EKM208P]
NDLTVGAVISGNRNFEGRVHAQVKANYLGSPPLVVAYALAGTVNIDLVNDPLGYDQDNQPVYLKDIWPTSEEIKEAISLSLSPDMFRRKYENVFTANEKWNSIPVPEGE